MEMCECKKSYNFIEVYSKTALEISSGVFLIESLEWDFSFFAVCNTPSSCDQAPQGWCCNFGRFFSLNLCLEEIVPLVLLMQLQN